MESHLLSRFYSYSDDTYYNKHISSVASEEIFGQVYNYVKCLISIPLSDYLYYLKANPKNTYITSEDITQASHIELCHIEMCEAFRRSGYRALELSEIGKYLHNDGKIRSKSTETKYGENVKGSKQLGLTYKKDGKWHLSCLGYVFTSLSESERLALMSRSLLRDPLYSLIFLDALDKDVYISDYMCGISDVTMKRRMSSVLSFCNIIILQQNIEGLALFHSINR